MLWIDKKSTKHLSFPERSKEGDDLFSVIRRKTKGGECIHSMCTEAKFLCVDHQTNDPLA